MKINRLLTAALITLATVLTSCVKESVWDRKTGIDESKAAPEEFTYDEALSSKTSLAVYWDGKKATDAGAQSFFVQLTDKDNMDKGNSWDSKLTKVVAIDKAHNVTFTKLTENARYFVRIRANYPGSVYSPWVYLSREDGSPALYSVGSGAVPVIPSVTLRAYVSEIEVTWTYCDAVKYEIEYKKKADAAWSTPAEATATSYTITGLAPETEYDVRVTSITANEARYTSEVATIMTAAESPFPMNISTAQQWMEFVNGDAAALANNGTNDIVNITADLDFTGIEYATATDFKGVVNGNNKTFKNIKASTPLFKNVTSVKDLTLDATCSFTTTSTTFAALAERTNGAITNVKSNANVTANLGSVPAGTPYVIGGLVAYAYGKIENCETSGNLTITADFVDTGVAGGIVAYTESQVNNSKNIGNVTVDVEAIGGKKHPVGSCNYTDGSGRVGVAVCLGGVVGLAQGEFSMENCENSGVLFYDLANITVTDTFERNEIGGIVGAPNGPVKNCKNTGEIKVNYFNPGRTAFTAKSNIICVGGIGGGDLYAAGQGATDYINCVNEGNIVIDNDACGSNSAFGGIVGWPGKEGSVTNVSEGCINRGNITVKGNGKGRVGGIHGGSGNLVNCENYGEVKIENADAGSAIGGIAGFHSNGKKVEGCISKGNVTSVSTITGGIGGLIGNIGNVDHTTGENCVVDCTIVGGSVTNAGMVVGKFNGHKEDAKRKRIVLGPLEVSGTVNGNPASASNLCGTDMYVPEYHTINATIK